MRCAARSRLWFLKCFSSMRCKSDSTTHGLTMSQLAMRPKPFIYYSTAHSTRQYSPNAPSHAPPLNVSDTTSSTTPVLLKPTSILPDDAVWRNYNRLLDQDTLTWRDNKTSYENAISKLYEHSLHATSNSLPPHALEHVLVQHACDISESHFRFLIKLWIIRDKLSFDEIWHRISIWVILTGFCLSYSSSSHIYFISIFTESHDLWIKSY